MASQAALLEAAALAVAADAAASSASAGGLSRHLLETIDVALEGRFDASTFRGLYQRNNKRGGLKNLRCFPSCGVEHRVRGFCGRSVVVTFRRDGPVDATRQYRAFVEFEEEPFEDKRPPRLLVSEVEALLRTKTKPTNPLIEGKHCFTKDNVMVFEFNQERRGWHYSWGSNKHKCDTKHRLVCRLYEAEGPVLVLKAKCASPEFVLFCRRRRRFTLEPTSSSTVVVTPLLNSSGLDAPSSSSSKRQRRTPNQAKFAQELELLSTVNRIESERGGKGSNSRRRGNGKGLKRDEEEEDEEDDSEDSEDDGEDSDDGLDEEEARPVRHGPRDQDVTDATHALLALTGAMLNG